jgi:uncharacterized repeat protein (TIGR03803 family)
VRNLLSGLLTTLAAFGNSNGGFQEDGLTAGSDGNFYGTTDNGGTHLLGTIFKTTPDGVLTPPLSFNGINGATPRGGLLQAQEALLISPGLQSVLRGDPQIQDFRHSADR